MNRPVALCGVSRGFTIVEMMVVLGVLAILLAIAAPVLKSVRDSSIEVAEQAHQRECGALLLHYASDTGGEFPSYGFPGTDLAPVLCPGDGFQLSLYWGQPHHWSCYLHLQGYDATFTAATPSRHNDPSGRMHRCGMPSAFDTLTYTVFAPSHFWRDEDPQRVRDHLPQRWHAVAHPSAKGILLRENRVRQGGPTEPELLNRPVLVWFADGHVRSFDRWGDLNPAVSLRQWLPDPLPVFTTSLGLEGRDVQ